MSEIESPEDMGARLERDLGSDCEDPVSVIRARDAQIAASIRAILVKYQRDIRDAIYPIGELCDQLEGKGDEHPSFEYCPCIACTVCSERDCPSHDPTHYREDVDGGCASCEGKGDACADGHDYARKIPQPVTCSRCGATKGGS